MILKFAPRAVAGFFIPCLLTAPVLASLRTRSTRCCAIDLPSTSVLSRQALAPTGAALFAGPQRYSERAFLTVVKRVEAEESATPSVARHSPFQKGLNLDDAAELAARYLSWGSAHWTNGWMKELRAGFDQYQLSGWFPLNWRFRGKIVNPLLEALHKNELVLPSGGGKVRFEVRWVQANYFKSRDGLRMGDGFTWHDSNSSTLYIVAAAPKSVDVRPIVLHELTETIVMNLFELDESMRPLANFVAVMMERVESTHNKQVSMGKNLVNSELPSRYLGREIGQASEEQLGTFIADTNAKKEKMSHLVEELRKRTLRRLSQADAIELLETIHQEYKNMANVLSAVATEELRMRRAA
jgi:hypothetical protein